jgi:hypothetical protein
MTAQLQRIVADSIARARRNAAEGLPYTYGLDLDERLRLLGLPPRKAVPTPFNIPVALRPRRT